MDHHHHPCHHPTAAAAAAAACCHVCYTSTCHHTPPPPNPYSLSFPTLSPPPLFPQQNTQSHFQSNPYHHHQQPQYEVEISSLLRRISALESSLRRHFPARSDGRGSLRDAAARTIQIHFRDFLVRRSRTLRQLKTLASIKSSLNGLKISVSENTRVDYRVVSRKAMDLLLKIDSIQGGDSMIRDGKRSISRDLDRFLHLIDEFSAKRNKISSIGLTNSRTRILYNGQNIENADFIISGRDKRGSKERMRARVDDHDDDAGIIELENFRVLNNGKIGSLPKRNGGFPKRNGGDQIKAKKNVTFSENGDISRGFVSTREPNSSEDDSVDEERELLDNLCKRVQKIADISKKNGGENQEKAYSEDEEESSGNSNGEENSKKNSTAEGNYVGDDDDFVFSAPTPVKMESRSDLAKTRNA